MSGKNNKNNEVVSLENMTQVELLVVAKMLQEKLAKADDDANAANDKVAELDAKLTEADAKFESQEKTMNELLDKLASYESQIKTGKVIVDHESGKKEVLTAMVPTFGLAGEGVKSIPASELHNHKEVINRLVEMKSGILVDLKG